MSLLLSIVLLVCMYNEIGNKTFFSNCIVLFPLVVIYAGSPQCNATQFPFLLICNIHLLIIAIRYLIASYTNKIFEIIAWISSCIIKIFVVCWGLMMVDSIHIIKHWYLGNHTIVPTPAGYPDEYGWLNHTDKIRINNMTTTKRSATTQWPFTYMD